MKKAIVALILAAGVTAIAFAAFDSSASTRKVKTEKKTEMKEKKKKECRRTCMYDI